MVSELEAESLEIKDFSRLLIREDYFIKNVDPGGPMAILLTTGSKVHGFSPGRSLWIFSERKNP